MPMFPVIFTTLPVHSDLSPDESRKEGEQVAYSQGADRQEAEDNARTWLSDLSPAARVYTKAGQARRMLGPVRTDPNNTPAVTTNLRSNAFVIYTECSAMVGPEERCDGKVLPRSNVCAEHAPPAR